MATAEIITIGTEILLGEIVDTNARYLARRLRDIGVDLYRKTTVGDNAQRIAQALRQGLERSDFIITTGGLGPTVDDPTREAVALAAGEENEYRPELWDQILARFQRFNRPPTENNKRQAYVPRGAIAIENPVGTAPAFIVEIGHHAIISLPGVPREMEHLMEHEVIPYLRRKYGLHGIIKARLLHTAGAGESQIDDLIGDLEQLSNPTVGLAAHSGQVDVRITAKANSEAQADQMIARIEEDVRQRLGDWIYGADEESLQGVAIQTLHALGWRLVVIEAGLNGELISRLSAFGPPFVGGETLSGAPSREELQAQIERYCLERQAEVGLAVAISPGPEKQDIFLTLVTPMGVEQHNRPYGGPPQNAVRWASNHSLNLIRNLRKDVP